MNLIFEPNNSNNKPESMATKFNSSYLRSRYANSRNSQNESKLRRLRWYTSNNGVNIPNEKVDCYYNQLFRK